MKMHGAIDSKPTSDAADVIDTRQLAHSTTF